MRFAQSRKAAFTLLIVVAVMLAGVAGVRQVPTAGAQDDAAIGFGSPSVTYADGSPIEEGKQLTNVDRVRITFPWSAKEAINDGQRMTITFPEDILLPGSNDAIPVSARGIQAGECRVDASARSLECRFNDSLSSLDNVQGDVSVNVGLRATSGPNWQFDTVPGTEPLILPIPGGNVVRYLLPTGNEDQVSKYGNIEYNEDPRIIGWTITVPSESFAEANNPAREVLIADLLVANNHDYVLGPDGNVAAYIYQEDPQRPNQAEGKVWPPVDAIPAGDGRGFTAAVTPPFGGWVPGWDLKVNYRTTYNGEGYPSNGEKFENQAQVQVTDSAGNVQVAAATDRNPKDHTYDSASAASGAGVKRGAFEITKRLEGEDADCVVKASDEVFTAEITIDVRESSYPAFDFPQTKTATGSTPENGVIAYKQQLRPDIAVKGYDSLPAGTKISVKEIAPNSDGVKYGQGRWSIEGEELEGGSSVTVNGEESENIALTLTNEVLSCASPEPTTSSSTTVSSTPEVSTTPTSATAASTSSEPTSVPETASVTSSTETPAVTTTPEVSATPTSTSSEPTSVPETAGVTPSSEPPAIATSTTPAAATATTSSAPTSQPEEGVTSELPTLTSSSSASQAPLSTSVTAGPSTASNEPENSSDGPWWILVPLIPVIPAILWLLGQQGPSNPPAPVQPTQSLEPEPTAPASSTPQPAKTEEAAKPGERREIKSVPSGASALTEEVARFIA